MQWRKWNNVIHRDLGYLCFGLTIIYAISGVAVNHIADWNPSYKIEHSTSSIDVSRLAQLAPEEMIVSILGQIGEEGKLKGNFWPDRETIKIFVEGNTVTVNLNTGAVGQEKVARRKGLFQINFLHLNHPKKMWTWFADLYAIALFILSCTGLFVLRGKKGISGRGAWLSAVGLGMPLVFLWLYS